VTDAAKIAGATREGFRLIRKRDHVFAEAWADAYEEGSDALEDEAHRRAVDGVEKPVTVAGQREVMREYSDKLLIFLLNEVAAAGPVRQVRERRSEPWPGPRDGAVAAHVAGVRREVDRHRDRDGRVGVDAEPGGGARGGVRRLLECLPAGSRERPSSDSASSGSRRLSGTRRARETFMAFWLVEPVE
jgi:hypothetical protein